MKSFNFNTKFSAQKKIAIASFCVLATTLAIPAIFAPNASYAEETANTTFQVNVKESLSVSITTPSEWASGNANSFLRNKVTLSVSSNNANGFTASMYARDLALQNSIQTSITLPNLTSSSTRDSFPANHWGFSLGSSSYGGNTYGETDAGNADSYYYPLASSSAPTTILTGTNSGSQNIYFGAKANTQLASGTYSGLVVISVVTDVIDPSTNPVTPTNPATPVSQQEVAVYTPAPTGSTSSGSTTYTYTRTNTSTTPNTTTTTTQVSEGNNVSAYNGYTPPQGVTNRNNIVEKTISDVADNSPVAAGLAATASAAAATGLLFFILAKKRDDDEEEEEYQQ